MVKTQQGSYSFDYLVLDMGGELNDFDTLCGKKFVNKHREIGKNIDLSFQIVDDILDYSQNKVPLGKTVLEDARQIFYSLPLMTYSIA